MKVFVFLLLPYYVFLEKLILRGFPLPCEAYCENLREISNRFVPSTPLGMVRSPSYVFCVIFVP